MMNNHADGLLYFKDFTQVFVQCTCQVCKRSGSEVSHSIVMAPNIALPSTWTIR